MDNKPDPPKNILLPQAPVLAADWRGAAWLSTEGEIEQLGAQEAARRAGETSPVLVHAVATAARLQCAPFKAYDLLELFAFVRPAQFCLPTARGLARALDQEPPVGMEEEAVFLFGAARQLLEELSLEGAAPLPIARAMAGAKWSWSPAVLAALGAGQGAAGPRNAVRGLGIWTRLKEWSEHAPRPPAGQEEVSADETRQRLGDLLGGGAEDRVQQVDYAVAVTAGFRPTEREGEPHCVLAEAGTGVGKTLGYIAPASLWAEKNDGTVWFSTYTRNLQRQLDAELDHLYPDPAEKALRAVVRKGRENYLCLLNFEEAVGRLAAGQPEDWVALGLVARWALASRDGDMVGGDFPGWLAGLMRRLGGLGLTDRRGECIHSACRHYPKCYVERSQRRAKRAHLVIANHALVMIQAALGSFGDGPAPTRYCFDEGHHLFDAADSAFAAHLSGAETAELRRWLRGAEGAGRSRARGLETRLAELLEGEEKARKALDEVLQAAGLLPGRGWLQRVGGGTPQGAAEMFLAELRRQVHARDPSTVDGRDMGYNLETTARPPVEGLVEAGHALNKDLAGLEAPLKALIAALVGILDEQAESLDSSSRQRLEAMASSLERRALEPVRAWRAMLGALQGEAPGEFVDWFSIERIEGREFDMGMRRNWIDPTVPFARHLLEPSHGAIITSATLRDASAGDDEGWTGALARTGLTHLEDPPGGAAFPSPFDYAVQTRVFIVNDLGRGDIAKSAGAYRELMLAAGGGVIGLFTAIARLRAVHERLVGAEELREFMLLAQHTDPLDTGTLVDIFRSEENACLLGTDAVRDGIDVPGRSLRMIIYDRVPWPRPSILHKARKAAWSEGNYDDMLVRLKLKQAYGRLVRRADDHGVFVMLDRALPSRLLGAFPEGIQIQRLGLAETISQAREFLEKPGEVIYKEPPQPGPPAP